MHPRYLGNFCTQVLSFHQLLVLQNHLTAMPNAHSETKGARFSQRCDLVDPWSHGDPKSIGIVWTEPLPMLCIADLHLNMDWGVVSMMSFMSRLECKIQIIVKLFMITMPLLLIQETAISAGSVMKLNGFDNAGNDQNIPTSTAPRALNFDRTQASGKFTQY